MIIWNLALKSLWNRRTTAALMVLAISISVALLLSVQMLRTSAKQGFTNTISGTDLIVGARTGPINLLLSSVFRIGNATTNVSWKTYQKIAHHPDVAWTIPISLGDSHRGFRVLGTDADYFRHYHFAGDQSLHLVAGREFKNLFEAVLGADVARKLHYKIGDSIILAHGVGEVSFEKHKNHPFRVVGILAKTGTPVDRTVHVGLTSITAIHVDWRTGTLAPKNARASTEALKHMDLTPKDLTAFLVGMRSKPLALRMQRAVNVYKGEPLLAIIPGVALNQLWSLVGVADTALMIVAAFVVVASLLGMLTSILTSLNERRREMAILRSVGARPRHILGLMVIEAGLLAALGVIFGTIWAYLLLFLGRPILQQKFGVFIEMNIPSSYELSILALIVLSALIIGFLPAFRAYRNTLSDGLQIRV